MTIVNAVKCSSCGDTIYSRARHDYRSCSCDSIFIDGGFDYVRLGGVAVSELIQIEVDATKGELYNDWGTGRDKFGRITQKEEE